MLCYGRHGIIFTNSDRLRNGALPVMQLRPVPVPKAWLLHQDIVTSVILGARRVEQLEDNLQSPKVQLSQDDLARLDTASALAPEYPGWMLAEPWDDRM